MLTPKDVSYIFYGHSLYISHEHVCEYLNDISHEPVTDWSLRDMEVILQVYFSNSFYVLTSEALLLKLVLSECQRSHWSEVNIVSGNSLVPSGIQAITQANVVLDLYRHNIKP